MKFRCAGYTESMIDGYGVSFVVYFQGCHFNCEGCHNKGLQDYSKGIEMSSKEIVDIFNKGIEFYDSFVFLGGEPLDQEEALRSMIDNIPKNKQIWLYTGYSIDSVPKDIQKKVDVIIAGRYVKELHTNSFPASSNQVVVRNANTERD